MTREEAIEQLTRLRSYCLAETGTDDRDVAAIWKADAEALSIALPVNPNLRPDRYNH